VFTKSPPGEDKPVDVVVDVKERQCFRGDAPVTEAEVLSALGGVLGDVSGGVFGSQLAYWAAVDALGVDLLAEAQYQPGPVGHLDGEPHVCGGLTDCPGQPSGIYADLRWLVVVAGTVETDERVEVDDAAALKLRDLHERYPAPPAELGCSQSRHPGQRAPDSNGESAPQFGCVPVECDVRGVVVTIWADRLPESRVALIVDGGAPGRPPVLAQPRLTLGWAAARWPGSVVASGVHRPESRRGEGGEDQRVRSDRLRYAFAATRSAGIEQLPHVTGVLI
jgi:hypothetical protein